MGTEILLAAAFSGGVLAFLGKRPQKEGLKSSSFAVLAGGLFLAALTLRLSLGYYGESFQSDLDTFKAWAYALERTGLPEIYHRGDLYLDYPPGYLYILLLTEKLRMALNIPFDAPLYTLLLKLPSLLADLLCAGGLLWVGKRKLG